MKPIMPTHEAAEQLAQAHRDGAPLDGLPDALRPRTIADAQAIQLAVLDLLGERPGAIKVNVPASGEVFRGIVPASQKRASGADIACAGLGLVGIEAEIAFHFPQGLAPAPGGFVPKMAMAAARAMASVDIVGTRYTQFLSRTPFERIADGLNAGAFVHAQGRADWHGIDFETLGLSVLVDGQPVFEGQGRHPAGDPFKPVLAYLETVQNAGLPVGTMITTGSFCGLLQARPGQHWQAHFTGFAPVSFRLVA